MPAGSFIHGSVGATRVEMITLRFNWWIRSETVYLICLCQSSPLHFATEGAFTNQWRVGDVFFFSVWHLTSRSHGRVSPHFENHCPSRPQYVAAYNQSGCYETDISSSLFPRAQLGSSTCPPPTHYIMFHSEINLGPFAHTQFGQRLPQIRCPDLKYVMHLVCEKDTEIPGMVLCNQCLTITRVTVVNGLILTRERSFMFLPVLNITQWLAISCWGGWLLTLFGHSSCGVGDDFLPFCCHRAALVAHCHIGV